MKEILKEPEVFPIINNLLTDQAEITPLVFNLLTLSQYKYKGERITPDIIIPKTDFPFPEKIVPLEKVEGTNWFHLRNATVDENNQIAITATEQLAMLYEEHGIILLDRNATNIMVSGSLKDPIVKQVDLESAYYCMEKCLVSERYDYFYPRVKDPLSIVGARVTVRDLAYWYKSILNFANHPQKETIENELTSFIAPMKDTPDILEFLDTLKRIQIEIN